MTVPQAIATGPALIPRCLLVAFAPCGLVPDRVFDPEPPRRRPGAPRRARRGREAWEKSPALRPGQESAARNLKRLEGQAAP